MRGSAGDGLPYGTPEGATASAVYQFEVAGLATDDGPSGPVKAAATVVALLGAGALGLALRSRLV
jgi:putative membrane protein